MPLVTVIVVGYNADRYLRRCVEALFAQTQSDIAVIVVDCGDGCPSLAPLRSDTRLTVLEVGGNIGFSAANNRAVEICSTPFVAFLNSDAFPAPDWLEKLLGAAKRYPEVVMFGSLQLDASNSALLDGTGDHYFAAGVPWRGGQGYPISKRPLKDVEVFSPCAAAALFRRETFLSVGGFDERFFCYCEDIDIGFQLRLKGERCMQIHDAIVYHIGSAIAGRQSAFSVYHGMRNRLWVFVKNMPTSLFWPLLPLHIFLTMLLFVKAIWDGAPIAALRGLRDGLLGITPIIASRRLIQAKRTCPLIDLLKIFSWSPLRMLLRGV